MNCPSRTDESLENDGWNQNPPALAGDLTTREDLNGIANLRLQRDHVLPAALLPDATVETPPEDRALKGSDEAAVTVKSKGTPSRSTLLSFQNTSFGGSIGQQSASGSFFSFLRRVGQVLLKFSKFIGPGFIIAVAYIDPGNYATDVAAGASTRFKLLFIVLFSNLIAILLQSLAVRLGTVTGLNLAENCRAHLPMWLNIVLYIFAEAAIIATDIAEVIGSAIALNLLLKIPLVAGCALSILDVLIILFFYRQNGSMRRLRIFELFIMALVLGVVICFCIQLSLISKTSVGEVFKGYLPSSAVVEGEGLYLSCGILGATVMPHSLYLGSGIVQARLRDFDVDAGTHSTQIQTPSSSEKDFYRPSLAAIKACLNYSIVELAICLCVFALFVNSAILIVAGASLSDASAADADLFDIYNLLSTTLAPVAGTVFALALLLSGTSAGIVCTLAGQMVSEGALNWTITPWLRRLITRSISIAPSIIIAGAVGREGLAAALSGTQVALSIVLPFVSAPLVYFTCRNKYMTVGRHLSQIEGEGEGGAATLPPGSKMKNSWIVTGLAVAIWLVIVVMNVALLVFLGLGRT